MIVDDKLRLSPKRSDNRQAALGLPLPVLLSAPKFCCGGDPGEEVGDATLSPALERERNRDFKPSLANRPRASSDEPSPAYDGGFMTSWESVVVRTKVNSSGG